MDTLEFHRRKAGKLARRHRSVPNPNPTGHLRAAATLVDITPAFGTQLGGSGFQLSDAAVATFGRLYASLLLIEDASGRRVLVVSADLHVGYRTVSEKLAEALHAPLGLGQDAVWFCASHTHGGPGNLYGNPFYDVFAQRLQGYHREGVQWLVDTFRAAAISLKPKLVRAKLGYGRSTAPRSFWNRSVLSFLANHFGSLKGPQLQPQHLDAAKNWYQARAPGPLPTFHDAARFAVDPVLEVLHAVEHASGDAIGTLALCHATPTMIPAVTHCMSGDVFGYTSQLLRRQLASSGDYPLVLVAGTMGDQNVVDPTYSSISAFRRDRKSATLEQQVASVRRSARPLVQALDDAIVDAANALTEPTVHSFLWEATPAGASIKGGAEQLTRDALPGVATFAGSELTRSIEEDTQRMFREGSHKRWRDGKEVVLPFQSSKPHDPKDTGLIRLATALPGLGLILPLFGAAPDPVEGVRKALKGVNPYFGIRYAKIGNLRLVGLPTEATVGLGERVRAAVKTGDVGAQRVLVFGLVGGFHGYASTQGEYTVQDYEGSSNLWGREFGTWIAERCAAIAAQPATRFAQGEATRSTAIFTRLASRKTVHLDKPKHPRRKVKGQPYRRIWWQQTNEGLRLAGSWVSRHRDVAPTQRLAASTVISVLMDGNPWNVPGVGLVNDRTLPFLLQRRLAGDKVLVLWEWEVMIPGYVGGVPGEIDVQITGDDPFAPLPGTVRLVEGWV